MKRNEYRIGDIAEATDRKVSTIRKHEREGWFDMGSLLSVARYIVAANLERANKHMDDLEAEERSDD